MQCILIHKLGCLIQLPKLKCAEPFEIICPMQNINTGFCHKLLDSPEVRSIISSSTKNFVFSQMNWVSSQCGKQHVEGFSSIQVEISNWGWTEVFLILTTLPQLRVSTNALTFADGVTVGVVLQTSSVKQSTLQNKNEHVLSFREEKKNTRLHYQSHCADDCPFVCIISVVQW